MSIEDNKAKLPKVDDNWRKSMKNVLVLMFIGFIFSLIMYYFSRDVFYSILVIVYFNFFALIATLFAQKSSSENIEVLLNETNIVLREIVQKLDVIIEEKNTRRKQKK